jgi:hypothetical protein
MKSVFGVALLCSMSAMLSGCSSDPTPDDFERFARDYAVKVTREIVDTDGDNLKITCKLKLHNLRKTDSLTSPFVGEAEYEVRYDGHTIRHFEFPKGKPGAYVNRVKLNFNWVDGEWQHAGGKTTIVDMQVPGLTPEQISKVGKMHDNNSRDITSEQSELMKLGLVNGWGFATEEQVRTRTLNAK